MNNKQSKRLRALVAKTSRGHPLGFDHNRYDDLKSDWLKTPKNERGKLMKMLEVSADNIAAMNEVS